ncbi:TIGR03943 family putative permease subunit [Paenibacillus sp. TSA_86.1]|uniref:TIGR03943 family putative permease subunit n=1 Tax=Paenibacillus sp. TSA_86.1 TaxID=3415649 RepID=UPI00404545C0
MSHISHAMNKSSWAKRTSIPWHTLIRAGWIGSLAGYIMHLKSSNALHYYLAPTMQKLLLGCAVPLLFIAVFMIWHALFGRNEFDCGCEHPPPSGFFRSSMVYGLIALPLLLGFLLPDHALGSSMASQKGMSLTYAPPEIRRKDPLPDAAAKLSVQDYTVAQGTKQQNDKLSEVSSSVQFVPPDEYSREFAELAEKLYVEPVIQVYPEIFSETLGTIDMFQRQFTGKEIMLTGFVYRDDSMEHQSHFALGRFLVMCCPADAAPFGVMIHLPKAKQFEKDSWVQVRGIIGSAQVDGKDTLEIRATTVIPINQPASPYIYTSADSVKAYDKIVSE